MKTLKLFWGVSGPAIFTTMLVLTALWGGFLLSSGVHTVCERAANNLLKNDDALANPLLEGSFTEFRRALQSLWVEGIDSVHFSGAPVLDGDIFGSILLGHGEEQTGWMTSSCEYPVRHLGVELGRVKFTIDLYGYAQVLLRQQAVTVLGFWIVTLLAIFTVNFKMLATLRDLNNAFQHGLESNSSGSDVRANLTAVIDAVPDGHGSRLIVRSLKKIVHSIADMADMRVRLQTAEARAKIAAQVAHDIRSPLSFIQIFAQKNCDMQGTSMLRYAANRIEGIANELLANARMGVHLAPFSVKEEALSAIDAVVLCREISSEKRRLFPEVEFRIHGSSMSVMGFRPHLERIFSNVIQNAIDATDESDVRLVSLDFERAGDSARIDIRDTGCGIPASVLSQIAQGIQVTTKPDGNGLGLTGSRRLLSEIGGRMEVHSDGKRGSLVSLWLTPA